MLGELIHDTFTLILYYSNVTERVTHARETETPQLQ